MPSSNDTVADTISTIEIRQNAIHKVTLRQELNQINKYSMQYWKGCSKSSLIRADHSLLELDNLGSKFKFLYPKRRILQFQLSACLNQRKSSTDLFTQLTAASTCCGAPFAPQIFTCTVPASTLAQLRMYSIMALTIFIIASSCE